MSQWVNQCDLFVIVGATGDLSFRKLLPALYRMSHDVPLEKRFRILGVSTDAERDDEVFRQQTMKQVKDLAGVDLDPQWIEETLFYQPIGRGNADDYQALAKRVAALEKSAQLSGNRVF